MTFSKVLFSRESDEWSTPKETYQALNERFHFTDDPCPLGATDGLIRSWKGAVFVNPPYSNIAGFLEKAHAELKSGNCHTVVFLIPLRTDTKYFHKWIVPFAEIEFIKGRLKFGNNKNCAPFPSMIAILRGDRV